MIVEILLLLWGHLVAKHLRDTFASGLRVLFALPFGVDLLEGTRLRREVNWML